MTVLLTMAEYKTSLSVFAVAAIVLGIYAYITLRDDPMDAGMYPDNVSKEEYERDYKNLAEQNEYVSDWTIPKMLKCKEVWLTAVVPGFITLGLLGIITQFVQRNTSLGMSNAAAISAMTIAGLVGIFTWRKYEYVVVISGFGVRRTGLSEGKRRDLPDQLLYRMSELCRKRCRHESDGKPDGRICGISVPVPCKHPDRIQDRRRKMG